LGNLQTPGRVQDPQKASHVKQRREVFDEDRGDRRCARHLIRFVLLPGQWHDITSFDALMAGICCVALIGDNDNSDNN
jgi:hypothetical protein